jgi:hypothetical protein
MLTPNCMGELRHERAAEVGKPYSHVFCEDDSPPILDPTAPKYDGTDIKFKENQDMNVPELRKILEENGLSSDGQKPDLVKRCAQADLPTKHTVASTAKGYIGKAKGAAHIGFERGFWDSKLRLPDGRLVSMEGAKIRNEGKKEIRDPSTSARAIL